jgi:ABC-type enterochelin transport system permease subunit
MPIQAIRFGYLLIAVGIIGYGYGWINGNASITALIPAFFGFVLNLLGYFAARAENLRKILMHAAVLVGLLGFISAFGRLMMKINEFTISAASISQIAMSLICLAFVILCVMSFVNARKAS